MIPTRRFGRTELPMPVLSLGGMRFQQSWSDLAADAIEAESQRNLEATLAAAVAAGFHHVETARYYGTSELQLGPALARHRDPARILQTKKLVIAYRFESIVQYLFYLTWLRAYF